VQIAIATTLLASSAYAYTLKAEWNEYKSEHFMVYSQKEIPKKYINEFTRKCEKYYGAITKRLGFNRFDFWTWENRAKIFLYESREEYVKGTGRPGWSAASVHIEKRAISSYYFEEEFFDTILPHEMAHIILREFIGFEAAVPRWLDEGVACSNEKDCYIKYLLVAKSLFDKSIYVPIPELEKVTKSRVVMADVFYPTAASLVIFLLEEHPKRYFVEFCREIRDETPFYEAMRKVYRIETPEVLNEKLIAYINSKSYADIAGQESYSVDW